MIELKTNVEQLDGIAANEISAGRDSNGSDIKAAALDHKNLQEYAERLEGEIVEMSEEIQKYKSLAANLRGGNVEMSEEIQKYKSFAANLHHVMRDNIADQIAENPPAIDDTQIARVVREMINDGEISVSVEYQNLELELSLDA
tara:strand:- start:49 stop:480 length:432 start_codon:yes stop_codon:yes gene_type:complete